MLQLVEAKGVKDYKNWCGEDCIWLTRSNSDENMLRNNLDIYELEDDWIPLVIDAQLMFDEVISEGTTCSFEFFYWILT